MPVLDALPAVPGRRGWEGAAVLVTAGSFGVGLVRFALLGGGAFGLGRGFGGSGLGPGPEPGDGAALGADGPGIGVLAGPGVGSVVVMALVAAAGAAVACWLVGARRAAADRAVLGRWTLEVLTDARAGLDTWLAERVLDAERRLLPPVERAVAARVAGLDSELRAQSVRAAALSAELAARRTEDAGTLARLRAALAALDTRLADDAPARTSAAPA